MSDFDTMDETLLDLIRRDSTEGPDTTYNRDALGATVYLYFLLKNKISSAELDRLVDWVNYWVDNILNKQLFSRFVDRELASALFGFYTLKIHSKLKTQVEPQIISDLMRRFGEDNTFFGNLTYTIMILLSVSDYRDQIPLFAPTLNWIKQQMDNGRIFNDGKNLVFASMLFEQIDVERDQKLVKVAFQKFQDQSIPFNEQMYYGWLLWVHKSQFEKKDVSKIRDFADSTLINMKPLLRQDQSKKHELETEYGSEEGPKVSRILVGVYLDLLRSYNSQTIRVDKSELETTSLLTRLGGLWHWAVSLWILS